MIFRHLLRLRQLERIFQDTWTEHLKTPSWRNRSPYPELQSWKGRVFALRARMYNFIQQMFDFAVSEVLEVRWNELRKKLERCETVDQLLKDHDNFLNTCTNECLLTNEKLLEVSRREKVASSVITDAGQSAHTAGFCPRSALPPEAFQHVLRLCQLHDLVHADRRAERSAGERRLGSARRQVQGALGFSQPVRPPLSHDIHLAPFSDV